MTVAALTKVAMMMDRADDSAYLGCMAPKAGSDMEDTRNFGMWNAALYTVAAAKVHVQERFLP